MVGVGRGSLGEGNIQNLEGPEAPGMELVWGSRLPILQWGAGDCPFPSRGLCWSTSRWARCQALREVAHPPPSALQPGTLPPPLPQPQPLQQFTLYLLLFSLSIPLPSPWEEPAGWQLGRNLLSPLRVPASPLLSAWTPCAGAGHSGTVPASHSWGAGSPWLITLARSPGTAPWRGWRSEADQQARERSGLRRGEESSGWGCL